MKREEFWLGVCIYLLIILLGHMGPDFSKIPVVNEKLTEMFRSPVLTIGEKFSVPMKPHQTAMNTLLVKNAKTGKRTVGYFHAHSPKLQSTLKAKGSGNPYNLRRPAEGPISPISFSL